MKSPRPPRHWRAKRPRSFPRTRNRASSPGRWGRRRSRSRSPVESPSPSCVKPITTRRADCGTGADVLLFETCNDTRNVKAGLLAVQQLRGERGEKIPVMVSGTIEPMGTMLAGQTADALLVSVAHMDLVSVGLNCATGPEFMTDHIRTLHEMASTRISCYPNAGLPDEEGRYKETPESLARQLEKFVTHGWLNIVGGCCGTSPDHIRAIARMVEGRKPREVRPPGTRVFYSGIELV